MSEQSRLEIAIDSRGAETNVRNLRHELSSLEGTGVRSLSNLRGVALAATGALAAIGVGVGFSSMLSDIRDFSTEMASLRAVSRASAEDMERLENQARLLGATTAFGANQAAQAQRFLAQGGLDVNQVLGATPQVMRLAQAGTLGLAEAADLATDVMGQMGLGVDDIERIGDVLVATAQSATTDVTQLGQALSFAGGQADGFGLSLEETVVGLGLISSSGIKASRAGTGLVGVLASLTSVTSEQEAILDRHNIALEQLDIEARGIVPVLETLAAANLTGAERTRLFGREAAGAANALINGLPAYREQLEMMGEIEGVAADAARTMTDHLGGSMRGLSSAVSEANLKLGDSGLTGGLRTMIDVTTGVVQSFNGLSDEWAEANGIGEDLLGTVEQIVDGLLFVADAGDGVGRAFELAGTAIALYAIKGEQFMIDLAEAIYSGPVEAVNHLIEQMNRIPGVSLDSRDQPDIVGELQDRSKLLERAAASAQEDMQDILLRPMASDRIRGSIEAQQSEAAGESGQQGVLNKLFGDLNEQISEMVNTTREANDATEDQTEELDTAAGAVRDFADTVRNSAATIARAVDAADPRYNIKAGGDTASERARSRFEASAFRVGESSVTNFGGNPDARPTTSLDYLSTARGSTESLLGTAGADRVGDESSQDPVVRQLVQANSHLASISQASSGEGRSLGTLTLASDGGKIDVEANAEELSKWLADTLSGAAASV